MTLATRVAAVASCCISVAACAELERGAEAVRMVNQSIIGQNVAQAPVRQTATRPTTSQYLAPAPDLFDARGRAMWDGRQTLQGIWVAHPLAQSARRVRITNPETGMAVDGALFRRDDSLAGPPVLISSEAAEALAMRPGYPVDLEIVALRKAPQQPGTGVAAATDASPAADTPPASSEDSDATDTGTAGTPVPNAADTPAPQDGVVAEATATDLAEPADTPPADTVEETAEPIAGTVPVEGLDAGPPTTAPASEETADRLAALPSAAAAPAEPAPAAQPAQPVQPTAVQGTGEEVQATLPDQPAPAPDASVQSAPTPPTAAPVAAAAPAATATKPAPEPASPAAEPVATQPEPEPEVAKAEPEPARKAPARLARPYLQAGTFSVIENADNLVRRLKRNGVGARSTTFTAEGQTLARVIAGPFRTAGERDRAQRLLRKLGIRDALPVRR